MQYVLLIYRDEKVDQQRDEAEMQELMQSYFAFTEEITQSGHISSGIALQDTDTATTVAVRDGETVASDGPFAETKEQLGGLYVINADNLDDAIKIAAKIPHASNGAIEVRPVIEMPEMPQS